MASVDHSIASMIAHAVTTKHAWETTTFASKSQSRIFGLREILANLRKEARPVADYMKEIKTIADDLASSGSPLTDEVLSGLGPEFKEISVAILARDNPISFEELYDKLLTHQVFVQYSEPKAAALVITAQFNQRVSNARISQRRNYNNVGNQNPQRRNQGVPNSSHTSNGRNFTGQNQSSKSFGSRQHVQCQLCDKYGHIAKVCCSQSHNKYEAQANMASRSYNNNDNSWIIDSGASHHMTDNLGNLTSATEFSGSDDIHSHRRW
ncbi:PREDICTED: uncharacterized protein LOC109212330 [Nicotiana attenuata]|uniref:uncharacterized protein LOC109212330 n=1 Tax=Nicotiana attenuata TaxID=49451 RepID=UPI000905A3C9|nr:PREDICTED: uncharacterized protein LOC109212330 [Nicotiana attenuata]